MGVGPPFTPTRIRFTISSSSFPSPCASRPILNYDGERCEASTSKNKPERTNSLKRTPFPSSPPQILQNASSTDTRSSKHGAAGAVDLDLIRGKDDPTTYFSDGECKIDFVLVYEEKKARDSVMSVKLFSFPLQGSPLTVRPVTVTVLSIPKPSIHKTHLLTVTNICLQRQISAYSDTFITNFISKTRFLPTF